MTKKVLFAFAGLTIAALFTACSNSKEVVTNAAKKLDEQPNYSWERIVNSAGNVARGGGKTEKGGYTLKDAGPFQILSKGDKLAIKTTQGWQSAEQAGEFFAMIAKNSKPPAAEVQWLLSNVAQLKTVGGGYSGNFTEEGAKSMLGSNVSGAKVSVRFWIRRGVLARFETIIHGTMSLKGHTKDIGRAATTDIKDVGTTTVEVSREAARALL
jgi:hypothetical protein